MIGQAVNSSSIAVGAFSEMGITGSFTDAGSTTVAGTLDLGGGMEVTGAGSLVLQGGSVITPDNAALTLDTGGTLSGYGTVALGAVNNGSITATGGNLDIAGLVSGIGQLTISNASELELGGATSDTVSFGGNVGTLKLDNPASFSGTIAGLALGDTIDLAGIQATSAAINGSTLDGHGRIADADLPGLGHRALRQCLRRPKRPARRHRPGARHTRAGDFSAGHANCVHRPSGRARSAEHRGPLRR